MKLILGVFLLVISSSLADDCEDTYDSDYAKCRTGICEPDEIEKTAFNICENGKCCVKECEALYKGHCTTDANCDSEEVKVDTGLDACKAGSICCIKQTDTQCDKLTNGKCKHTCSGTEQQVGNIYKDTSSNKGCMCPSIEKRECCAKKGDDACEKIKGGKCISQSECADTKGIETIDDFCEPDKKCCVGFQACERDEQGICVDKDKHCPTGFSTAEEYCKNKPKGVYEWCKDDGICCMKDR